MRQTFLPLFIIVLLTTSVSAAHNIGAGIILGDPSGLTAKIFMGRDDAIDFGIGESADDVYIYGDYLRHFYGIFPLNELAVYLGIGGALHDWEHHKKYYDEDELRLEMRVPVGIEFIARKVPVGVFLELVPVLRIIPHIHFGIRGGLGARYYF